MLTGAIQKLKLLRLNTLMADRVVRMIGPFSDWDEASKYAEGYDQDNLLKQILKTSLESKNNDNLLDRDGVIFSNEEAFNYPFLTAIGRVLNEVKSPVIVDFGGALGSSYRMVQRCFPNASFNWIVVEQEKMIHYGEQYFTSDIIRFSTHIDKISNADCIIFSGVLTYLPNPYEILRAVFARRDIKYVLIDRQVMYDKEDGVFVQKNPFLFLNSSYSAHILNREKFLDFFNSQGIIKLMQWESLDRIVTKDSVVKSFGFLFLKDSHGIG